MPPTFRVVMSRCARVVVAHQTDAAQRRIPHATLHWAAVHAARLTRPTTTTTTAAARASTLTANQVFMVRPAAARAPTRQKSAATAAVALSDKEDELRDGRHDVLSQPLAVQRPRLRALRDSLAAAAHESSPSTSLHIWKSSRKSISANISQSSCSTSTASAKIATSTNLETLRQRLALLPEPSLPTVLQDSHARHHNYLRLSLTERCNLRCTYCMPEQGVPLQANDQLLSTAELLRVAALFAHAGVTKWRLTGGEPTLRADLLDIVAGLQQLSTASTTSPTTTSDNRRSLSSIGITTNGIVLAPKLKDLHAAGLTSVNISLDTLNADTFARLTRRPAAYLGRVWQSIEAAMALTNDSTLMSELQPRPLNVKLNCVVMRGVNDHEIPDFIQLTDRYPGLQVRFIEYMPFVDNGWDWSQCVPYQEILTRLATEQEPLIPVPSPDPHDTTKWYTTNSSNHSRIGFITSMSEHFCATCNRLRITADGTVKVCLFDGRSDIEANGGSGALPLTGLVSLRDAMRAGWSDAELYQLIHQTVQTKHAKLGGHADPKDIMNHAGQNRPMTLIGG
jgi:GTP 3',8-cyclase